MVFACFFYCWMLFRLMLIFNSRKSKELSQTVKVLLTICSRFNKKLLHKVTTTMRPLPTPDIIPPMSTTHPEANMDRDKLKMLKNNVNMMQFELNKICKRFKIATLNRYMVMLTHFLSEVPF